MASRTAARPYEVPRGVELYSEVPGLFGPQRDGLAESPGCSARVCRGTAHQPAARRTRRPSARAGPAQARSRSRCCPTPPSVAFRIFLTVLCTGACRFQRQGSGQFTSPIRRRYLEPRQIARWMLLRPSSISNGSRPQPKPARLSSTPNGAPPSQRTCGSGRRGGGGRNSGGLVTCSPSAPAPRAPPCCPLPGRAAAPAAWRAAAGPSSG